MSQKNVMYNKSPLEKDNTYYPTPEEIEKAKTEIREGWSEKTFANRVVEKQDVSGIREFFSHHSSQGTTFY